MSTTTAKTTTTKTVVIGRPSTTTTEQPEEDIIYEDEEEEEEEEPVRNGAIDSKFKDALEEEDPEVIKELITLIKKVGGLDELEKQLQLRLSLNENSPIVNGGAKTTTTMSPISKSLYEKVISTRRGLTQNRKESVVVGSTRAPTESVTEPILQRQNKENRYSSVVRNSRPRPQNDGIDQLSEVEGGAVIHERPQYVTITRTQSPRTSTAADDTDFDEEEEEDAGHPAAHGDDEEEEEEEYVQPVRAKTTTTHQPTHSYVNIRRSRPTTPTTEKETAAREDDDESSTGKQTTRMQYVSIKRTRPSYQPPSNEEIIDATPESK